MANLKKFFLKKSMIVGGWGTEGERILGRLHPDSKAWLGAGSWDDDLSPNQEWDAHLITPGAPEF